MARIIIGSWSDHSINEAQGPIAAHTKLGWVLSGPVCLACVENQQRTNLVTAHVLKCATDQVSYDGYQGELKNFWDLESLGVKPPSVFEEKLLYKGDYYEVSLLWKATNPPLPENYASSLRRLQGLLNRLREKPDILKEYDSVITDQIESGIVEVVNEETKPDVVDYIPHHAVIRRDKSPQS